MLDLVTPVTTEVLRQAECFLSIAEIARSNTRGFTCQTGDQLASMSNEVFRGLLAHMEQRNSLPLPVEITTRLLSLITSVICLVRTDNPALSEIQLRLLRHMDSCAKLPVNFTGDLVLLHFQSKFECNLDRE